MTLSLNEVAAQARKAARGAGFEWGMADEAARATRWLCAHGIDGCAALAACLDAAAAGALERVPERVGRTWQGPPARPLCPIHAGACLSDRAAEFQTMAAPLEVRQVLAPALLLPFLSLVARRIEVPLRVEIGAATVLVGKDTTLCAGGRLPTTCADLQITQGAASPEWRAPITRAAPDPAVWDRLADLAHRTYAPATDASRARGAGGDLPDTD